MLNKNKKFNKSIKKPWIAVVTILLAGAVVIAAVLLINHRGSNKIGTVNNPVVETVPSTTNHAKTLESKGNSTPSSSQSPTPQSIPMSSLIRPYGTFVSNHYPSLSGTGAPSQEESVCTSNPGVSCYIQFTKDGVTKKLLPQVTDDSGSTSWNWDVKKSGFTTGNWLITAVVTSGNNSKSRQDSIMLNVSK